MLYSSARLFQEYVVDQAGKIQNNRLTYFRTHQTALRVESYHKLEDDLYTAPNKQSDQTGQQKRIPINKKVILPLSFTDSPRYLQQKYQNALAMVCKFEKPDLFITFTCNPKWKKITYNVLIYQKVENRPNLINSVFRLKYNQLIREIVEDQIFGKVAS